MSGPRVASSRRRELKPQGLAMELVGHDVASSRRRELKHVYDIEFIRPGGRLLTEA